ncbi:MAG: creatininase family protein [Armatimonadetes bacterium]|nr:creatininase family protein [Armatimonadota bacterium]
MTIARPMLNMTVEEIREGLEQTRTVVLPVGICEQHGYHLPVSVDLHNASEIAHRTSEKTGCFVAPPLPYNFSGGMLPGTINISPQVFGILLMDILQSLTLQGFRQLIILLGHGGSESVAAAKDAAEQFQRLRPEMPGVTVSVVPFWELSPTYMEWFARGDYHAGMAETSLMLFWKPELVNMDEAVYDDDEILTVMRADPDAYARKLKSVDTAFVVPRIAQDPRVKVGVMGFFDGANAELGHRIADECIAGLADLIAELEPTGE